MCEGKERRRERVLHEGEGKREASVGLSIYRKCKGNRRGVLPMGNTSDLCFEKAAVVLLDLTVTSYRLPWNRNSLRFAALQQMVPRASGAPGQWVPIAWRASQRCHHAA